MATHAHDRGMTAIASGYEQQAAESEQRASVIRNVLMPEGPDTSAAVPAEALAEARGVAKVK
jgi:hypothetical protein